MDELTKIACIDDEPDLLELIKIALTAVGGFDVTTFRDGPSAIAGLQDSLPQLILLDFMMPGMSGIETLQKLETIEQYKNIPIIIMTARVQGDEKKSYYDAGAVGVITKPFDPMTLPDEIREIWIKVTQSNQKG